MLVECFYLKQKIVFIQAVKLESYINSIATGIGSFLLIALCTFISTLFINPDGTQLVFGSSIRRYFFTAVDLSLLCIILHIVPFLALFRFYFTFLNLRLFLSIRKSRLLLNAMGPFWKLVGYSLFLSFPSYSPTSIVFIKENRE